MKDTTGQKNNTYYHNIINRNKFNTYTKLRSSSSIPILTLHLRGNDRTAPSYKNKSLSFIKEQKRYFHINKIRAINRIGPHNLDILSVIIGSVLGDAYLSNRSGEGVRICYRQSIIHKEYLH